MFLLLFSKTTKHWNLSRTTKHQNLSRATKHWNLQGPPSIRIFHWNLSRATKHWNLSKTTKHQNLPKTIKHWNLPLASKHQNLPQAIKLGSLFTSFLFLFFKSVNSGHLGFYFLDITFNLNFEKIRFYNFPWEEKND